MLLARVYKSDKIGLSLILISSILLGVWATMHTIALRNVLLGCGALIAIFYWASFFRLVNTTFPRPKVSYAAWIPLFLIASMFLWVVIHIIYFSVDPARQFNELDSTWVRAFLATLLGSATGLALIRNKFYAPLLWIGLIFSFLILIGQYIPKALQRQSIFAIDHFADYIYWAKFNGVLAGTVLIAGLLGLLIDYFCSNLAQGDGDIIPKYASLRLGQFIPAYVSFGVFLPIYSFVFIFDAKAGIGLSVILIGFWIIVGLFFLGIKIFKYKEQKKYTNLHMRLIASFFIFAIFLSILSFNHMKNNPGWETIFQDIAISAQIDKYPNWQNPGKFGYPSRGDGSVVPGNTYERVSWGMVGLRLIDMNPLGNGLLRSFPEQVKKLAPEFNSAAYTHSAWIDLGLAFGLPGLLLIPIALLIVMGRAAAGLSGRYTATIITLSLAMLVLYSVGEYAFQHSIEILFYVISLLGGLSLVSLENLGCVKSESI